MEGTAALRGFQCVCGSRASPGRRAGRGTL